MSDRGTRTVVYFSQPVDMGHHSSAQPVEAKPHHMRDYHAIVDVHESIRKRDDRIVRIINVNHEDDLMRAKIQRTLKAGDVIIQACRIWIWKDRKGKKMSRISGTWLEDVLIKAHERWFEECSRKRVTLKAEGARVLMGPDAVKLASRSFTLWSAASYFRRGIKRTAGYIVFTKELWPGGPDSINVFGLSGPVTLGLAAAIRDRCRDEMVFNDSELIFIEIVPRSNKPIVPTPTPAWLAYWEEWLLTWHRSRYKEPKTFRPGTTTKMAATDA